MKKYISLIFLGFLLTMFCQSPPLFAGKEDTESTTAPAVAASSGSTSDPVPQESDSCAQLPRLVILELIDTLLANDEYFTLSSFLSTCKRVDLNSSQGDGAKTPWVVGDVRKQKIKNALKQIPLINEQLDILAKQTGNEEVFNQFHRKEFREAPLFILQNIVRARILTNALYPSSPYWVLKAMALKPEAAERTLLDLTRLKEQGISITLLPPEFKNFQDLKTLILFGQKMPLFPKVLTTLPRLETLDISNNGMVFVPSYIGDMTPLREINLKKNKFASLPASFGRLWDIKQITINTELYRNQAVADQINMIKNRRSLSIVVPLDLRIDATLPPIAEE